MGGSSLPAVRVELNPSALFNQGVSLDTVRQAIANANVRRPQGAVENPQQRWQIRANDALKTADAYRPLIIHYNNGSAVRLADVAEVKDSVQDVRNAGMTDAKPAIILAISRAPDANIIETVDRIRAELPALQENIPASIQLNVAQDRSPTIRASLAEVEQSLAIAIGLVITVVFIFLRSGRATLIPAVAVPVSLVGSFAAMYLCGFSLNNLSLMALTIATGFVVDDAIVVLENISRHVEAGMKPINAALLGAREVGFTVLSMSVSLVAVFIPLLLMEGLPGRLFREFAVTLSVSIGLSLIVSLTLTPMMCAYLLRHQPPRSQRRARGFGKMLLALQQGYGRSLNWVLGHSRWVLAVFLATLALNVWLYISIPKTFFPEQDTGRLMGFIESRPKHFVPGDARQTGRLHENRARRSGRGKRHRFYRRLAYQQRFDVHLTETAVGTQRRRAESDRPPARSPAKEPGASLFLMAVQDIRVGGRQANASYQYTLLADDLAALREWEPKIRIALAALPELADVNSDQQDKGSEMDLVYDRETMARLGISVSDANNLLNNAFGQRQISTIYQPLNQYKVVMEVAPPYTGT